MRSFVRSIAVLLAAGLVAALPAFAQDATPEPTAEQPPLLDMLALVPNVPEAFAGSIFMSYVDYEAIVQARPDVPAFESWAEFDQTFSADDDRGSLWMMNSMRIVAGPEFYLTYLRLFDETEALVGFDVFDIDRALVVGQPP